MKAALILLAALAVSANAKPAPERPSEQVQPVDADAICLDGKPVGIEIEAPFAGTIAVQIPPNVCEQEKPKPRKPNI